MEGMLWGMHLSSPIPSQHFAEVFVPHSMAECLWQQQDQEDYRAKLSVMGMAQRSHGNQSGRARCHEVGVLTYKGSGLRGWEGRGRRTGGISGTQVWGSLGLWAKISELLLASRFSPKLSLLLHHWHIRKSSFYLPAVPLWNTEKENQIMWVKHDKW